MADEAKNTLLGSEAEVDHAPKNSVGMAHDKGDSEVPR